MDLNEIVIFAKVVETGGFSAAARQLDLPKSTVSRKVSELEDRIGARLIHRTTRKLGLTDAGRLYYEHGARIVAEVEEAEQSIRRMESEPRGLLRVTAPLAFDMLGPILADYLGRHPDVRIDLTCSDRNVDLVEEGYDVAIRAGHLADSSLVARSLGTLRRILVAAPAYLRKRGRPRAVRDLTKHECIVFGAGNTPNLWTLFAGYEKQEIRVTPRLSANNFEILMESARAGVGIAMVPEFLCAGDLRARRLARVLPDWCSAEIPVQAVYPTARHLSPKVSAFIELVRASLKF
jgi:DNA-binding transcriptional LysR family regulator